ncbi:response regulator transcription factor [Paenibacillus lignilyticus]|uniref:Heme response regulator HssR n=1 Tax=Paenibacillus lignilyticus TaxID=1172615 RepID=A0ABS5CCB4_9BACL|nr:response regulator transcription factor [Paenibacillus lignilyticus]MBP3961715.1 response regulator transcription factor [Paenibacillus lignilyticus]MBP3963614.1 response regulator transcription factor [Paenibacillus lignilyticus]
MVKIALVDDDVHIRELVRLYLSDEGFEILEFANGEVAWLYVKEIPVDMVIMDIMMPRMDGYELCKKLRESGDMPILMITAKGESEEKIKGFQLGTDDYLTKPFDPMELVVRVKALLKRYRITSSQMVAIGSIVLDRIGYQVIYKDTDTAVTIPMKEFELLYKLASHPGQLFTRATLIEQIWGFEYEGDERTVDVHIKRLRERFAEYETTFRIVTLRGLGYRLEVLND